MNTSRPSLRTNRTRLQQVASLEGKVAGLTEKLAAAEERAREDRAGRSAAEAVAARTLAQVCMISKT